MAGTARAGATGTLVPNTYGFLPGMTRGTIPFGQWDTNGLPEPVVAFGAPSAAGARTDVTKTAPAKVITARPGATSLGLISGVDWYDTVHILPRGTIDFGNIITQEEEDYEIYSAYRTTSITLTLITNNALPGTALPNTSTPTVVPPSTSLLDPTSTDNSGGSTLGTLVKLKVQALADGLPQFNASIVFTTTGGTVTMVVAGSRLVFFPFEYEAPMVERMQFLSEVLEALSGKEQRLALRKNHREGYELTYLLDGNDRQRMQVLLMDWMDNTFGVPLFHQTLKTTAAVSAGATSYSVQGADNVEFRVGGLGVIFTDANTFDVLNIVSVTATTITVADPSVNAYPAGTQIMPLRIARIRRAVQSGRALKNLERFNIDFEVTDNDTGALAGDTSAYNSYNSRVLLDDCNVSSGEMPQRYTRKLFVIDNETGQVDVQSNWDRFKREQRKGFVARSRSEILALKKLLVALRGKQTAFYMPTFFADITAAAGITSGTATLDIENIEYARFANSRRPKKVFKITFTDGTSLIRSVTTAVKSSSTVEQLTLDTTWPTTRPLSDIAEIQFYELVRFDTDRFSLRYPRIGLAELFAPVKAVFDDVP